MTSRSAREEIMARLRTALADAPSPPPPRREYRQRGAAHPGSTELIDLLTDRLTDYQASVHRVTTRLSPGEVAADALHAAGSRVAVVPAGLPEGWRPPASSTELITDSGLDTTSLGPSLDRSDATVTGCATAIAETGTIVLDGRAEAGRRAISLIPDHHVCLMRAEQIVATVPEALADLDPFRPLTFISGPSATSDIELERVEGVHGPRRLDVVIC